MIYIKFNQYYNSQKNSDCCFLRDQFVDKAEQEIPDYGTYYKIDNDTFFKCLKDEAKTDDLKEYVKKCNYPKYGCIINE